MANTCFCGCGRRIGRASRRLNRDGELLHGLLVGIHAAVLPRLDPGPELTEAQRRDVEASRENMRRFADEGTIFRAELIRVLHDEASIRDLEHARMLEWIRTATDLNKQALYAANE